MSYKKIIISKFGAPEVLKTQNIEKLPEPASGEVRIKVLHSSANFTDTMIRKGMFAEVKQKPPFSPGFDMVGIIDKNGKSADRFEPGRCVADLTITGAYSEYICLPENQLVAVPENVDTAEATALILSWTTAYQMLHRIAKIQKGQRILVHGASGAVGQALLQLGKRYNLEMYGTASKAKHELVSGHNGTPVDYKEQDFEKVLLKNPGKTFDAVFDAIGGKNFKKSFNLLKPGSILVAYGFYNAVTGKDGSIPADFIRLISLNLLPNGRKAKFYSIVSLRRKHPEWFKQDLGYLFQLLKAGCIKPFIGDHYPLEKALEAHQIIESSRQTGKIIFDIGTH